MAERTGGEARPSGEVTARKVTAEDRAPKSPGVRYDRTQISARLTEDGLSVTVQGFASFGGRTVSKTAEVDLSNPEVKALAAALAAVAHEYEDAARDAVMEAAYEARALAQRSGEDVTGEENSNGR